MFCTLHPMYVPSKSGLECLARPGLRDETTVSRSRLASRLARSRSETQIYHRPGDKNQLKAQDVTAKLVRFDILRKVPKIIYFVLG